MKTTIKKASVLFNKILHPTLGKWLVKRFNIQYDTGALSSVQAPYFLFANHSSNWDGFIISVPIMRPLYYVVSDEYFRSPFMRFVMSLIGAIPKTKLMSDAQTVRLLLQVRKMGEIICLMPEGRRNWDGRTLPILPATAKMVKSFGMPAVVAHISGAYMSQPRWAKAIRKNRIHVRYIVAVTAEETKTLSAEAIHERLTNAMTHDDLAWCIQQGLSYDTQAPAEYLEKLLFACPTCGGLDVMRSNKADFTCSKCGYHEVIGLDGHFLKTGAVGPRFPSPVEWNDWQHAHLKSILSQNQSNLFASEENAIITRTDACHRIGGKRGRLNVKGKGRFELFTTHLAFTGEDRQTLTFDIPGIHGMNIQYNDELEFYHGGTLHRFSFSSPHVSAYLWQEAIRILTREDYQEQTDIVNN